MTSDEFFGKCQRNYDIIFVDGLHEHNQVYKDVVNGLNHLNKGGVIVMHDCHPPNEWRQRKLVEWHNEGWNGDCWKAFVKARATLPYEMWVWDDDEGCGVIDTNVMRKGQITLPTDMEQMTWKDFVSHPEWFDFRRRLPF